MSQKPPNLSPNELLEQFPEQVEDVFNSILDEEPEEDFTYSTDPPPEDRVLIRVPYKGFERPEQHNAEASRLFLLRGVRPYDKCFRTATYIVWPCRKLKV